VADPWTTPPEAVDAARAVFLAGGTVEAMLDAAAPHIARQVVDAYRRELAGHLARITQEVTDG
jgi:hypothetical protein